MTNDQATTLATIIAEQFLITTARAVVATVQDRHEQPTWLFDLATGILKRDAQRLAHPKMMAANVPPEYRADP